MNQVKENSNHRRATLLDIFATLYFFATTVVIGFFSAYMFCLPIWTLSLFIPKLRRLTDVFFCHSVYFLMRIQPWLKIKYPERKFYTFLPVMTLANHRSHLDMFLLLTLIAGIRALAKSSLFFFPGIGIIMWGMRHFPVKRRNIANYWKALDAMTVAANRHEGVVHFFPEMTRHIPRAIPTGVFEDSVFRAVMLSRNRRLLLIAIEGTEKAWPKCSYFVRWGSVVSIHFIESVDCNRFGSTSELSKYCKNALDSHFLKTTKV